MKIDQDLLQRLLKIGCALRKGFDGWTYVEGSSAQKKDDDDIIIATFKDSDVHDRTVDLEISLQNEDDDVYFTVTSPLLEQDEMLQALLASDLNVDETSTPNGTALIYVGFNDDLESTMHEALRVYDRVVSALKKGEAELAEKRESVVASLRAL